MVVTMEAARVNAKLTQREAADKLGVSRKTLVNWETGKTYPKANMISKICNLYGAEYNDIKFGS